MDNLLSLLTKETLSLDSVSNNSLMKVEYNNLKIQMSKRDIASTPGVLYIVCDSLGTFKLEVLACRNMLVSYDKFNDSLISQNIYPGSEFSEREDYKILSFATDNYAEADVVSRILNRTRFLKREEAMSNLSDPGFSWWLNINNVNRSINISFSLLKTKKNMEWINMGLLGDDFFAEHVFKQLNWQLLDLEYCKLNHGFSFVAKTSESFNEMKKMWRDGDESFLLKIKESSEFSKIQKSVQLFLKELTIMRRFWIDSGLLKREVQ